MCYEWFGIQFQIIGYSNVFVVASSGILTYSTCKENRIFLIIIKLNE